MNSQVSRIKNAYDGKTYIISTCKNPLGLWETGIFEPGGFLRPMGKLVYGTSVIDGTIMERLLKAGVRPESLFIPDALGKPMGFIPAPIADDVHILRNHNASAELVQTTPPI